MAVISEDNSYLLQIISTTLKVKKCNLHTSTPFSDPLPLAALVRVPFHASVLNRPRHRCRGEARHDGMLPNRVDRRRLQSVFGLSQPATPPSAGQTVLPKPLHAVHEDVVAALAMADLLNNHAILMNLMILDLLFLTHCNIQLMLSTLHLHFHVPVVVRWAPGLPDRPRPPQGQPGREGDSAGEANGRRTPEATWIYVTCIL